MEKRDQYLIIGSAILGIAVALFFEPVIGIFFGALMLYFIGFLLYTNYRQVQQQKIFMTQENLST